MKELRRILHVEDEQDILDVAGICLSVVGGFEVEQYLEGAKAVENAGDFLPDLFLLDMMMPDMDGMETLRNLRKCAALSDVPAIFVTAKNLDGFDPLRDLGSNVIGVIEKPFEAVQLAETINTYWNEYQAA